MPKDIVLQDFDFSDFSSEGQENKQVQNEEVVSVPNNESTSFSDILQQTVNEENASEKPLNLNSQELQQKTDVIASDEIAKKSQDLADGDLAAELKEALFNDETNFETCFTLISKETRGFRGAFVGDMTGTKGISLKKLNKVLYKMGKVNKERYVHLAFAEIENIKEWDTQTLYVVSDLSDAYVTLFTNRLSDVEDPETASYNRMLESLLNAPLSAYIVLDAPDIYALKSFLDIDPRIEFIFSKRCFFRDYSDEKIATDLIEKIKDKDSFIENPIDKNEIVNYLDANRRFFPFRNEELTNYLALNYESTKALPPAKEDTFDLNEALDNFIGLRTPKLVIKRMEGYLKARKLFEEKGIDISTAQFSLHTALLGVAGTGKCLPLDESILTPSGWVKNGDIKVGDEVFDHEGNVVTVTGVYPNGVKPLYLLTFDDGTQIKATEDHLWLVQDSIDRCKKYKGKSRRQSYRVISTKEMIISGTSYIRADGALITKYSIPVNSEIPFSSKDLPIDPYLLGAILANGSFSSGVKLPITNEKVLENLLKNKQIEVCKQIRDKDNTSKGHTYIIKNASNSNEKFSKGLRELGLLGLNKSEFFIPDIYKFSSIEQRKELFKALVDVNGTITVSGIVFRLHSDKLKLDVLELARSLGAKATATKAGTVQVTFPDKPLWASTLENKIKKILDIPKRNESLVKYIKSITLAPSAAVQCISVEGNRIAHKKGEVVEHYAVELKSGKVIILAEDELLECQDIKDRITSYDNALEYQQRTQGTRLLTPKQIMDEFEGNESINRKNLSVPLTRIDNGDDFEEDLLSFPMDEFGTPYLHPYILGAMLGDGHIGSTASITNADTDYEIIQTIKRFMPEHYTLKEKSTTAPGCSSYNFVQRDKKKTNNVSFTSAFFEPLGLADKTAKDKFIPNVYLTSSLNDRIWLFKGLMDTDGYTDGSNIEYTTISAELARNVRTLAISLGGSASISEKPLYTGNIAYRVTINFPREYAFSKNGESNVFNLKRKAEKYQPVRTLNNFKDFIIDIRPIGESPAIYDIRARQNNTYIAGQYIVTHNTTLARVIAHLYYSMGFLKQDKLIEMGGIDLMGQSEAISARKATRAIDSAMGGALFIDEAYGLTSDAAIAALVKAMTDHVKDFAIFVAGYPIEMNGWLALNSGLKSRIGTFIQIEPYNEEELLQIYLLKAHTLGFTVDRSPEFERKISKLIDYAIRTPNSGQGRFMERVLQATLLKISEEYFKDPSRDISVIDEKVVPPISEVIRTSA